MPKPSKRPRCWECSEYLYGGHGVKIVGPDGHEHEVHKRCAKPAKNPDDFSQTWHYEASEEGGED